MPSFQKLKLPARFSFKCIRCARCCGTGPNVSLTIFDVVRIALFLRVHWEIALKAYAKVIIADLIPFMALKDKGNGECVFLERSASGQPLCVIYPARPLRCRLYPVLVESLDGKTVYLDLKCPGVGENGLCEVPARLVHQYIEERRRHYRLLYELVIEQGFEPLEALYKCMELAWDEAVRGAEWASIDFVEKLGYT